MSRVTTSPTSRSRRKKILKAAKGHSQGRHRLLKTARNSVQKALTYAYRDRRQRKRQFRNLWIIRINAAARQHGLTYSRLINSLAKADIQLNRKVLAHLAVSDPDAFGAVVEAAKAADS